MPTRIPLVNGIRSSPAARIVSSRRAGCLVGEPWWATRSGLTDSSISPCDAVTSRSRARSSRAEHAEVRVRQQPALQRPLARPHDVGDEVLVARARAAARARRDDRPGASPVSTSSSLTRRRAAPSSSALDLVGLVQVRPVRRERAVLAVAPARPRQRQRHVAREGDAAAHGRRTLRAARYPRAAHAPRPLAPLLARRSSPRSRRGLRRRSRRRPPERDATLLLDFTPNAVHAGIYLALRARLRRRRGRRRSASARRRLDRRVKLLLAGRADFAILDIHDLGARARAGARPRRRDGARPAPARRGARPARRSRAPRDARGPARGVTGLPSRRRGAALDRRAATAATRRRCARPRSASRRSRRCSRGRVDGATAFWNVEGVALQRAAARHARVQRRRLRRPALPRARAVRDAARRCDDDRSARARRRCARCAAATRRRWRDPRARRRRAARARPGLDARRARAQLDAVAPAFTAPGAAVRRARPGVLRRVGGVGGCASGSSSVRPTSRAAFDTSIAR